MTGEPIAPGFRQDTEPFALVNYATLIPDCGDFPIYAWRNRRNQGSIDGTAAFACLGVAGPAATGQHGDGLRSFSYTQVAERLRQAPTCGSYVLAGYPLFHT